MDQALYDPATNYSYLKIDIQGAELEAFRTGTLLLEQLVMIRSEVSFVAMYHEQPLFGDIHGYLRSFGFQLLNFVESHHWRRRSRSKFPSIDERGLTSKGQLIHGDALFIKPPEAVANHSDANTKLLDLAFLAYAYGEVDVALDALDRLTSTSNLPVGRSDVSIAQLKKWMVGDSRRRARREGLRYRLKDLAKFLAGMRV